MPCVLCHSEHVSDFSKVGAACYHQCQNCRLIFLDPAHYLSLSDEKKRYDLHNNEETLGYLNFLSPVISAVEEFIPKKTLGLDYGCGPTPVLATRLSDLGYKMSHWDPYFFPENAEVLLGRYSFVTCTEVIEHLHRPAELFENMQKLLCAGGTLFIMTLVWSREIDFANWHYRRDPTHVCFFTVETMQWVSGKYNFELLKTTDPRIFTFKKGDIISTA